MEAKYSKKEVGARLKDFRVAMKQTQREFAEQMNWDVNTYRKIETGASLLTSDKAQMLHEKFDIDITYILTGERTEPDDFLKQVWITANKEQRKELLLRLFEYIEKML